MFWNNTSVVFNSIRLTATREAHMKEGLSILIYIAIIAPFAVWVKWRFLSRNLYDPLIFNIITAGLWLIDIVLIYFTYTKINYILWSALAVFSGLSLIENSGWLARSKTLLDLLETRRMNIGYWQDVAIDIGYVFLIIQVFSIILTII